LQKQQVKSVSDSSFVIGQRVGQKFKDSTIDQLNAILAKAGVNVASLGDGGASEYGSGGRYTGGGRSGTGHRANCGRSRSIGGGHEFHAADRPYRGEPVLDEGIAADTDAARSLREGFKQAQDSESHLQHGAGTPDHGTSDAARDPGAAKESAIAAATRDPSKAAGSQQAIAAGIDRSRFAEEIKNNPELMRRTGRHGSWRNLS
jgi:hypothetical protein